MPTVRFREAARAILLDEDDHVLLARYEFPTATVWALPGGGLEDGEEAVPALRRELWEELGVDDLTIGPHVWSREHIIPMYTGHDGQRDHIHLVRCRRFAPQPTIGWDRLRAEFVHELRWWCIDEIAAATDLRFAPRRLAALLAELVEHGEPVAPIDTGV